MDTRLLQFLTDTEEKARTSGHVWPEYAACEAALESNYGASQLAREANNLFGMKAHSGVPSNLIIALPTREWSVRGWVTNTAYWMKYATVEACFADRMLTLRRLSGAFVHYASALKAQTGEGFVEEVSKTWSTDPKRAEKVLEIHKEWKGGE